MKLRLLILVLVILMGALPAAAQDATPAALIPADFAGFVRLHIGDTATLDDALIAASLLQPLRFDFQNMPNYDSLLPLTALDVEGLTFTEMIMPWVGDEVIVAYRAFGEHLQAEPDDILLILPTRDPVLAAANLAEVLAQQDLLERDTYRGVTVYLGDMSSIALAGGVVVIGPTDLVKAALDLYLDAGESLIDQPGYRAVHSAAPANELAFVYLNGAAFEAGLGVLLSGTEFTGPLFTGLGQALDAVHGQPTALSTLLSEPPESIGVRVTIDVPPTIGLIDRHPLNMPTVIRATATIFLGEDAALSGDLAASTFDTALLELVPQNAIAVYSGTDASGAAYDLIAAMPLAAFAGNLFQMFSVDLPPDRNFPPPEGDAIQEAAQGFLTVLDTVGDFDLNADLLDHLSGSFVVTLLPRPNDPAPTFNTPFDTLILARARDAEAARAGLLTLLDVLGISELTEEPVNDMTFYALRQPFTDAAIVRIGVLDDVLVIATGDALEPLLQAARGNNRLVTRDIWGTAAQNGVPPVYVNLNAIYNTFVPEIGALFEGDFLLTATGHQLDGGLFQIEATMNMPIP